MTSKTQNPALKNMLNDVSSTLKAMADPIRLLILVLLSQGERCVCDIHEPLNLPQNLVSHHLRVLKDNYLVNSRHEGRNVIYSIEPLRIDDVRNLLASLTAKAG